ncbi:MAG: hypothetical protein U0X93_14075 [Anaerolineales bacterium]
MKIKRSVNPRSMICNASPRYWRNWHGRVFNMAMWMMRRRSPIYLHTAAPMTHEHPPYDH